MQTAGDTWYPSVWYYHVRRSVANWDLTPAQIAGVYLVLGFLALYFSDVLLVRSVDDPATLSQLQALKGGAEVAVTGGLIYVLTRRSRRSLKTTNRRLERQREELQVLHRVLRHNLRNDVTIIAGYGTSLVEELEDGRHRAWGEKLVAVAERIVHYADQTQKINQVTAAGDVRVVDLVDVVAEAVNSHRAEAASVVTSLPETAPVRANPMLGAAVEELLMNAVRHADRDHPAIEIRVDPRAGPPHRTTLAVSDDGPGIPAEVRRTIEERGESQLLHLDGLGLWLVSWVATVSEGVFSIGDRESRGTTVRLELPKANAGPLSMATLSSLAARFR